MEYLFGLTPTMLICGMFTFSLLISYIIINILWYIGKKYLDIRGIKLNNNN